MSSHQLRKIEVVRLTAKYILGQTKVMPFLTLVYSGQWLVLKYISTTNLWLFPYNDKFEQINSSSFQIILANNVYPIVYCFADLLHSIESAYHSGSIGNYPTMVGDDEGKKCVLNNRGLIQSEILYVRRREISSSKEAQGCAWKNALGWVKQRESLLSLWLLSKLWLPQIIIIINRKAHKPNQPETSKMNTDGIHSNPCL